MPGVDASHLSVQPKYLREVLADDCYRDHRAMDARVV